MRRDVILIHGMWCRSEHLEPVAAPLREAGYRVHMPTLPFHEVSGREDVRDALGRASLLDYVDYVQGVIHQLNLPQPPIVLGHSMGGVIAQLLAARIDVQALILLTPAAPAGVLAINARTLRVFWRRLLRWNFWNQAHAMTAEQARRFAFTGLPVETMDALYPTLGMESGRALFEIACWPVDRRQAARLDPTRVRCPVFILGCEDDWLSQPDVVRKVAALYPQATLRIDADRGHWVIGDQRTEETMTTCIEWLEQTLETAG